MCIADERSSFDDVLMLKMIMYSIVWSPSPPCGEG